MEPTEEGATGPTHSTQSQPSRNASSTTSPTQGLWKGKGKATDLSEGSKATGTDTFAPLQDEETQITPLHTFLHQTPATASGNPGLSTKPRSSPHFIRASSLSLKQLALDQLKSQRDKDEKLMEGKQTESLMTDTSSTRAEGAMDKSLDRLSPSKDQPLDEQPQEEGLLEEQIQEEEPQASPRSASRHPTPAGPRSPSSPAGIFVNPEILSKVAAQQAKDFTTFPLWFMYLKWNISDPLPKIAPSRSPHLPQILVIDRRINGGQPTKPQENGRFLHVSLPTTVWPVMDETHLFIADDGIHPKYTYFGKYRTPRDRYWEDGPAVPKILDKVDIEELSRETKSVVAFDIWYYGAGKGCIEIKDFKINDYTKALANFFHLGKIFRSQHDGKTFDEVKDEVLPQLKNLPKPTLVEALKEVSN